MIILNIAYFNSKVKFKENERRNDEYPILHQGSQLQVPNILH